VNDGGGADVQEAVGGGHDGGEEAGEDDAGEDRVGVVLEELGRGGVGVGQRDRARPG
jgi:hypothetical protein